MNSMDFENFFALRRAALQRHKGILLFLAILLLLVGYAGHLYVRSRDLSPLLGSWRHPRETLTFRADGTLTEIWSRRNETGHTKRRWYRNGNALFIEGAVGYNQWLRCQWLLTSDRRTLTLIKYYESGDIITMAYRHSEP
jgi:hypothetical protein